MPYNLDRPEKEIISEFKQKLSTDSKWAEKAIVAIYKYQTADEQTAKETTENNGVGFTGVDAAIFSSFAEWIMKGNHLTDKQIKIAFKAMPKYAKQLYRIAKANQQIQ